MLSARFGFTVFLVIAASTAAPAQVPVIDNANLGVARENARNTGEIRRSNEEILRQTQSILQALSGQRTGDAQEQMLGLGLGGASIAGAPQWGQLLQGGTMSFGGMGGGDAQNIASALINGLQLARSLQNLMGRERGAQGSVDQAYLGSVNTATLLSALTSQASQGVTSRSQQFTAIGGRIGTSEDVKGSVDQNSQLQVQTGLTINELIGVTNGAVAALNAEQVQRITRQSETARFLAYESGGANPFAGGARR
jgi:hypothetical protein